jgi:hypothetical protein
MHPPFDLAHDEFVNSQHEQVKKRRNFEEIELSQRDEV